MLHQSMLSHTSLLPPLLLLIYSLGFSASTSQAQALQERILEKGYTVMEDSEASFLYNNNGAYIMGINLEKMKIQSFQKLDSTHEAKPSLYLEGIESPYYQRIDYQEVIEKYKEQIIINASFFENYEASTPLSYPIFDGTEWISGGSSPYGPVNEPINDYYGKIDLLALHIDSNHAFIQPYAKESSPSTFMMVSQNYSDHPAKVLANNRFTRFLLVTTYDQNEDGLDEWLIFSIGFGQITTRAEELLSLIPEKEIMTLDGGSSVLLYHPSHGVLHHPVNYTSADDTEQVNSLPHYLLFAPK